VSRTNQPVSIEGIEIEIIHFINLKVSDGITPITMNYAKVLEI